MIIAFDVGVKNLSYCICDDENKILEWERVSIIDENINIKRYGINELTNAMLNFLYKTFDLDKYHFTKVLIENQPSVMNGLMKSLSMVIYVYFKMMIPIERVSFINACNKLKCTKAKPYIKVNQTYNQRKKLAIDITRMYLEELAPDRLEWFDSLKKADDYSDCFLYIMYIKNI